MELLTEENREQLQGFTDFLKRPGHMRLTVLGMVSLAAYFGVYEPLMAQFLQLGENVRQTRSRYSQIQDIQNLGARIQSVRRTFPEDGGSLTWWTRRIVDGASKAGVDIETLSPNVTNVVIEDFTKVEFQLSVSGSYLQIVKFLVWVESGQPPIKISKIALGSTSAEVRKVSLTLESLMLRQKPKTTGDQRG